MEVKNDDIQQKQQILQTEIMDKNYDKNAFINYCLTKKENGDDLNNWTVEELTQIVNEFIKTQNEAQQPPSEIKPEETQKVEGTQKEGQEIKKEKK